MTRFQLDTATGQSDLAWNVMLLFFLLTFLALRPPSLSAETSMENGAEGRPVLVAFESATFESLVVKSPGALDAPTTDAATWLVASCQVPAPPTVEVMCPDDATHAACRALLGQLLSAAPGCSYRY